jgi:hypothetical protein
MPLWIGAGAMLALALGAGLAEHRRGRRREPDRVGWINWPLVQFVALFALLLLASIALTGR